MWSICLLATSFIAAAQAEPLVIQEQGSFAAGGTVITAPGQFDAKKPLDAAGQTYHGDHAAVFYQIPPHAHKYPIVMLHGAGQFSRTWESTPDGREGFQNLFLRRGFATYLVDQPRRGSAGRSTVESTLTPKPDEQLWFNQFRLGVWPNFFKGVQFSQDKEALNQYFRQMTPNTGSFDVNVISDALSAVVDKSGPAILFTHSQDSWRVRLAMARQWRDVVNKHGGDVQVIHLPEIGIKGNTHFPFSDLNNVQIADQVSHFLQQKHLQ
ncbi:alpha/beta fold hydrolase [Pantoea sp. MMK3]|uniref:Alpha/beta fold hydrolase n=1 Tax=Pantoea trifolii TaxID=2968030 RepID=A0ABT1VMJ4_9GAMM|nr:alpha/beta fold hydrolase [Pantoea sp. MMK2]MCQ8236265.1 alpha/beta fold hydrolase [Pantoea sp. MMK3]